MTINLKQLIADREAGTNGPWHIDGRMIAHGQITVSLMCDFDSFGGVHEAHNGQINASRIARLPDLEAAFLEAVELIERWNTWACGQQGYSPFQDGKVFLEKLK